MPLSSNKLESQIPYRFVGPKLNTLVPPSRIAGDEFSALYGVDGRFQGCLRNYYGNREVLDLADVSGLSTIDSFGGLTFCQYVTFQKRTTSTIYRGFVIRWDAVNDLANQEVDLVYTTDGTTWTRLAIWSGVSTGIATATQMECAADRGYLLIAVDGKATKTVYWNGSALTCVDAGPGDFATALGALTETAGSQTTGAGYHLSGSGIYEVAWRFYSSTRGIYSALSDSVTVYMNVSKLSAATGAVYFSSAGGDSGLMVSGDIITVNGRTFKYIAAGGDVTIPAAASATIAAHANALADAINADTDNCGCTARADATSVTVIAVATGTAGNAYTLAKSEAGGNTTDLSVSGSHLAGGGETTTDYESQCKVTLDLPNDDAVISGKAYADFAAMFDTLEVFRTISLENTGQSRGILYLEQSIAKTASWATDGAWDALQVTIGEIVDDALPLQTQYDPGTDIVAAPPQSGTIGRYQGVTFMVKGESDDAPYDTLQSSLTHLSPEYFTTFNVRRGSPERGRPLRYLSAGDAMFILCPAGITHVYKPGGSSSIQYIDVGSGMGLDGKWPAHSMGNSVVFITSKTLAMISGNDANIATIGATSRILLIDWKSDIADYVTSGYDKRLKASFFLNSSRAEVIILWHENAVCTMLKGAPFVWCTSGPAIDGSGDTQVYLATAEGLIVTPDVNVEGSGTMTDLSSSYTLQGLCTSSSASAIVCTGATFHADMVGSYVYMKSGANAGVGRKIASVNAGTATLTLASVFSQTNQAGDVFVVSPVVMGARCASARQMDIPQVMSAFDRVKIERARAKFGQFLGLQTNVTDTLRVGVYRDSDTLFGVETTVPITADPSVNLGTLTVDGIEVQPYIEFIGAGAVIEITDIGIDVQYTESRKAGSN